MPSLREVQIAMCDALYGSDTTAEAWVCSTPDSNGAQRLALYRSSVHAGLSRALCDIYPVVRRLVGGRFFDYLADSYIGACPSRSGDLHEYGAQLPLFIQSFEATRQLPYLADVARLEWAWHRAFHAADAGPLDATDLAAVPESDWGDLGLALQPGAQLLGSDYPVLQIWQANQPGNAPDESIELTGCRETLLVRRDGYDVVIELLNRPEFVLLCELAAGATLGRATDAAGESEGDFDLGEILRRRIGDATICGLLPAGGREI